VPPIQLLVTVVVTFCIGGGCGVGRVDVCGALPFARLFADEPMLSSNSEASAVRGHSMGNWELQSWGPWERSVLKTTGNSVSNSLERGPNVKPIRTF
jgi:hypothetical protein